MTSTFTIHQDNYFMDIEREALEKWEHAIPKGVARRKNKTWIKHIGKYIDYGELPKREHIKIYKRWIKNGNGDEWFM